MSSLTFCAEEERKKKKKKEKKKSKSRVIYARASARGDPRVPILRPDTQKKKTRKKNFFSRTFPQNRDKMPFKYVTITYESVNSSMKTRKRYKSYSNFSTSYSKRRYTLYFLDNNPRLTESWRIFASNGLQRS